MSQTNAVDATTTTHLIEVMNQTDARCDAAQRSVDGTASYLGGVWTGQARNSYLSSIQRWQDGLAQVKRGLQELNTAMNTHYQLSTQLEQDNTDQAAWDAPSWT